MTYYHGSTKAPALHSGLCLVADETSASHYGRVVTEIEIDESDLVIEEVEITAEDRDNNDWPGDTAAQRAALIADGIDAVTYYDETPSGRQHRCLRLLSDKAIAAATITE